MVRWEGKGWICALILLVGLLQTCRNVEVKPWFQYRPLPTRGKDTSCMLTRHDERVSKLDRILRDRQLKDRQAACRFSRGR